MSFAQAEYLPFLLGTLVLFQLVPRGLRVATLLAASVVFYLWWSVAHGLLLLGSIAVNWAFGIALGAERPPAPRRLLLWAAVVFDVGLLAVFKYGDFAVRTLEPLLGWFGAGAARWPELVLPLGISFYTFQALGYVIDVHRRRVEPVRSPLELALYVAFFPQLVAGPIERAPHLLPQLRRLELLTLANLSLGGRLILWGLLKKLVLAEHLRQRVWPVFEQPGEHDPLTLLVTAVGMYVVLYLDFSAYTDLARGSARLFGVELVHNFDRPFLARSMADYARRWHVSLITWIRDYVWLPLATREQPTYARIVRNNLLVMGLFGLWHGASWTFVLWGLSSGAVLAWGQCRRLAETRAGVRRAPEPEWGPRANLQRLATILYGSFFIVLFFSPAASAAAPLEFAARYYAALFELDPAALADGLSWALRTIALLFALFAGHAAGALVDLPALWERIGWPGRTLALVLVAALLLFLRPGEPQPFIYFRF